MLPVYLPAKGMDAILAFAFLFFVKEKNPLQIQFAKTGPNVGLS